MGSAASERKPPDKHLRVKIALSSALVGAILYLTRQDEGSRELTRIEGAEGARNDSLVTESLCIWPEDCDNFDDRIINQLTLDEASDKVFKIYPPDYGVPLGSEIFKTSECSVDKCEITYDRLAADALIFQNSDVKSEFAETRRPDQIWIAYLLESPVHTYNPRFKRHNRGLHQFNWTASYRSDSDIVTPYSKFVRYLDRPATRTLDPWASATQEQRDLVLGKSAKVAWFVSNCNSANSRFEYARELAKHIQVDVYGKCGNFTCDKRDRANCLDIINRQYKFYLSFENSNCREYLTEKLYENALGYNDHDHLVVPIVMGPPKSDYLLLAPPNSFIHVDDFDSPSALAGYLRYLDQNHSEYFSHFQWKKMGRFIDTKFMCRVCSMLHHYRVSGKDPRTIDNVQDWWNSYRDGRTPSCQ